MECKDPVDAIKMKRRQERIHSAAQEDLDRQEREEHDRLNISKVPKLIQKLLNELDILYQEMHDEAGDELERFNLSILNVPAGVLPQESSITNRFVRALTPRKMKHPVERAIWQNVATAKLGGSKLFLHIDIVDGTVYMECANNPPREFDEPYAQKLPFTTLEKFCTDVTRLRTDISRTRDARMLDDEERSSEDS